MSLEVAIFRLCYLIVFAQMSSNQRYHLYDLIIEFLSKPFWFSANFKIEFIN
jgi:hypothetical protein